MSILDYFSDWQKMTVATYSETNTYNASTGQYTSSWAFHESLECFVSQASAGRKLFTDKMIDDADFLIRTDSALTHTDIVYFNNEWFSMPYPNDILFQNELYTSLIKRIETPNNITGTLPKVTVLGDGAGLL